MSDKYIKKKYKYSIMYYFICYTNRYIEKKAFP